MVDDVDERVIADDIGQSLLLHRRLPCVVHTALHAVDEVGTVDDGVVHKATRGRYDGDLRRSRVEDAHVVDGQDAGDAGNIIVMRLIAEGQVHRLACIGTEVHAWGVPTVVVSGKSRAIGGQGVVASGVSVVTCGNPYAVGMTVGIDGGGIPPQLHALAFYRGQCGQLDGARNKPVVARRRAVDNARHNACIVRRPLAPRGLPPAGELVAEVLHPRQRVHCGAGLDIDHYGGAVGAVVVGGPHGDGVRTAHRWNEGRLRTAVEGQRGVAALGHGGGPRVGEVHGVALQQRGREGHRRAGEVAVVGLSLHHRLVGVAYLDAGQVVLQELARRLEDHADILPRVGTEGYAGARVGAVSEGLVANSIEVHHVGGDHHDCAAVEVAVCTGVFQHHVAVVWNIHRQRCHRGRPIGETQVTIVVVDIACTANHLPAGQFVDEVGHPR